MHIFPINDGQTAVQFVVFLLSVIMGLSHIIQPGMWAGFFEELVSRGTSGVVLNSFLSLGPAVLIVTLHEVWSGPAIVVTLYGWLLLIKAGIGLLAPQIGLRSMKLSRHGEKAFIFAGVMMLAIAGCAAAALWA